MFGLGGYRKQVVLLKQQIKSQILVCSSLYRFLFVCCCCGCLAVLSAYHVKTAVSPNQLFISEPIMQESERYDKKIVTFYSKKGKLVYSKLW